MSYRSLKSLIWKPKKGIGFDPSLILRVNLYNHFSTQNFFSWIIIFRNGEWSLWIVGGGDGIDAIKHTQILTPHAHQNGQVSN